MAGVYFDMPGLSCKIIEETCSRLLRNVRGSGELPYKETPGGFWATSIMPDVQKAFMWVGLDRYKNFVDLGSGDGRVVALASMFVRATGIEIDPELYQLSTELKKALRLDNVDFYLGNYESLDLSNFDFIYMYPDKPQIKVEKMLKDKWHGTVLIAGPHFSPVTWNKVAEKSFSVEKFTQYRL